MTHHNYIANQYGHANEKTVAVVADRDNKKQRISRFSAAKMKVTYNRNYSSDRTEITKIFDEIASGFGKAIARAENATSKKG